jgi:tetratricopeptide (TPR) repeat protein
MPSDRSQIRAFLSSTFSDFQEERDLLAKQVFPTLRQKAKGHGVEVVDVDLRWGITEEQSQQGQTLPICLAEIENCRPYFIGLLGERYGWVPEPDQYSPELFERQGWLREHQGGASVTELEILHGVLNNPDMAGRALFYFRDPAYSTARAEAGEPGWRSEGEQERQKLESLKQRIRVSGFPVVEGLADPQAIAERIEADLWRLIEQQFPEREPPDALAIEAARHASYRADRTGLYLGGESYIHQLEQWIDAGEQRLLITGESGSGKSALIANWMAAYEQCHPDDVIYSHHLGCSNDANALRPLLARLIDTAAQLIEEDIKVPQDWWELVATVGETLARLSLWARRRGCRWILVLDGLDKLAAEDQKALPWQPVTLPEAIHVVTSALEGPARTILQERNYHSLAIGPLQRPEQEALIDRYLRIFARQLDAGLKEQLLAHPLAGSPLFLRVLLEELRQCGRFETLKQQLDVYLSAQTIDDLYERVLERLENDGHGEAVQKALTALWASRAGLSEPELLAITGLTPAAWAPIGIGLQAALGESNGRLVFGHDFLRIAVQDRYLPTEEQQRQAHSDLADWCEARDGWDKRDSEELPWQLHQAKRLDELRAWLLRPAILARLRWDRGSSEVVRYWINVRSAGDGELDELIADGIDHEIDARGNETGDVIWLVDGVADVLAEAGLYRQLLLKLRTLSLELEEADGSRAEDAMLASLQWLADVNRNMGCYDEAEKLYLRCLEGRERLLGIEHDDTLSTINGLAETFRAKGAYEQAEIYSKRNLEVTERLLGPEHPGTLSAVNNFGLICVSKGEYKQAEELFERCIEAEERLLGPDASVVTVLNLAGVFHRKGDFEQAEALYRRCLAAQERLLGPGHPYTLNVLNNLGLFYRDKADSDQAVECLRRCLHASESLQGAEHPDTLVTVKNLALLYSDMGDYEQAEALYKRDLEARERLLGAEHPDTNSTRFYLANLYSDQERYGESIPLRRRELEVVARRDGRDAPGTLASIHGLADDLFWTGDLEESEQLYREALAGRRVALGDDNPATLRSLNQLAIVLRESGELEEAESLFRELVAAQQHMLEADDFQIGRALGGLAKTLEAAGKLEEAATFAQQALTHRLEHEGSNAWWTNCQRLDLAGMLHKLERDQEALTLLDDLQTSLNVNPGQDDDDRELLFDAAELRSLIAAK